MSGVQLTVALVVVMSDTFTLVGGSGSEDNTTLWRGTYIALEMGHGRLAHQTHDTGHVRHTSMTHHFCGNKADGETFISQNLRTATSHGIMGFTETHVN